ELDLLNNELIEMASLVEKSIEDASKALIYKDVELAKEVIEADKEIDNMENNIEARCLRLILQQHPVARDLRLISSILKMITDLERIGDQAQDIGEIILTLSNQTLKRDLVYLPKMAEATIKMVKESIDAFVNRDMDLANQVIEYDDVVDNLFVTIKDELIALIRDDMTSGEQSIDLLMVAKYFERIGDHAQNIAEWVVFSITGEHAGERKIQD
ncbi:MAG: phosphate signaling complex protein PhoU, partial [Clostridiales bacterium]|nr:phosphate signaling complex protein PhoU [Clostridiales bacterium]